MQSCSPLSTAICPLFVLRASWFEGPHFQPSIDLPLLFFNQSAAEQVALQSAQVYSQQHPVRTILNGNDYSFATRGRLFWIRCIEATIVHDQLQPPQTLSTEFSHQQQAYCIMARHVIGGTGNPNSRRGTEHRQGCVVVASNKAAAQRHLQSTLSSEHEIVVLPIVEMNVAVTSTDDQWYVNILQAWPDAKAWVPLNHERPERCSDASRKREGSLGQGENSLIHHTMEADWEAQPTKKRAIYE